MGDGGRVSSGWDESVVLVGGLFRGALYRCGMRLAGRELCLSIVAGIGRQALRPSSYVNQIKTSQKRVNH